MSTLKEKAESILAEKNNKILSSKIKKDWQIFDVTGNYEGSGEGGSIDLSTGVKFAFSMFSELPEEIENANWEDVIDMYNMFYYCTNLITIPQIDTSNVTRMDYAFYGCNCLNEVQLIDTSNVVTMSYLFYNCHNLRTVAQLNTSNVTNMDCLFWGCNSLTSIPLLNTSNVRGMYGMFYECYNMTTIPLLDTSSVQSMESMFRSCHNLTSIPLLDTSSVITMHEMFYNCGLLSTIPQFDTINVQSMDNMFYNCSSLTSVPRLNMRNVTNVSRLFCNCSNLQSIDLYTLNVENITSSYEMLYGIPQNCEIIVKSATQRDWLLNNVRGDLTNIVVTGVPHNITINSDKLQPVSIGYEEDIIKLKTINQFEKITQFTLNGTLITGNSFEMPDEDVTIDNVVIVDNYVIESEHNPYQNNVDTYPFDGYVNGASKLKLDIDYGTESGCDRLTIFYYTDEEATRSIEYTGEGVDGSDIHSSDTIYTFNNYLRVHWFTDGSVNNFYGFKITITRLDENGNEID